MYLFNNEYHTDYTADYMAALGMSEDVQESVIRMHEYDTTKSTQAKIDSAKSYLVSTDWIIAKISEANVLGGDINELSAKYSNELEARESARNTINELE